MVEKGDREAKALENAVSDKQRQGNERYRGFPSGPVV